MKNKNYEIFKKIIKENKSKTKLNKNKSIASIAAITLGVLIGHKFL